MRYLLDTIKDDYGPQILSILNYYIEHSFNAYFEYPVPETFFARLKEATKGYPAFVAKTDQEEVVGFTFLHAYHPATSLGQTAELTSFIHPDHTGRGLGKLMLDHLIAQARRIGITNLVASISSENQDSLSFHRKHGFVECGRLKKVGRKFDQDFDVIYMQHNLNREAHIKTAFSSTRYGATKATNGHAG